MKKPDDRPIFGIHYGLERFSQDERNRIIRKRLMWILGILAILTWLFLDLFADAIL